MNTVATVAYGFVGPDAIQIFLQLQGYRVSVFTGNLGDLDLRLDKPEANVVILPNFSKRGQLAPIADKLGWLIVLANGQHEPIVEHDIPILDGYVDQQGALQLGETKNPQYYIQKMKEAAIQLDLGPAEPSKARQPKRQQKKEQARLDQWLDTIETTCGDAIGSFDQEVEYPICQYLTGELSRDDFRRAMRALVKNGGDEDTMHRFYRWLSTDEYADRMANAMRAYLLPDNADDALPATAIGRQFRVASTDMELLDSIYNDLQKDLGDNDDEE